MRLRRECSLAAQLPASASELPGPMPTSRPTPSHENHGDEEEGCAEGGGPQELAAPKLRASGTGGSWEGAAALRSAAPCCAGSLPSTLCRPSAPHPAHPRLPLPQRRAVRLARVVRQRLGSKACLCHLLQQLAGAQALWVVSYLPAQCGVGKGRCGTTLRCGQSITRRRAKQQQQQPCATHSTPCHTPATASHLCLASQQRHRGAQHPGSGLQRRLHGAAARGAVHA